MQKFGLPRQGNGSFHPGTMASDVVDSKVTIVYHNSDYELAFPAINRIAANEMLSIHRQIRFRVEVHEAELYRARCLILLIDVFTRQFTSTHIHVFTYTRIHVFTYVYSYIHVNSRQRKIGKSITCALLIGAKIQHSSGELRVQ